MTKEKTVKNQAHLALYRRYRPQDFSEVIGQEVITKALQGAIKLGNIAHAYLFAGSRGTGKTSVARIFARAIGTKPDDLYEMDAASNRGIDDIREIRDAVNTLPFNSKYKVYIIDEVHMLTKEAFNALLKTLEEPPAHVIFILATTESHKLPETVISRCQAFQFKKPTQSMLCDMVLNIAQAEKIKLDRASAELIALVGDGSFRDTIGILEKVISIAKDKKISLEEVEVVTGAPKSQLVNQVISALADNDLEAGLSAIRQATAENVELKMFLKMILQKVRFVLLLRYDAKSALLIKEELSETDFHLIDTVAKNKESKITSATLYELLTAYEQTGQSYIPQLPLELALVKLLKETD